MLLARGGEAGTTALARPLGARDVARLALRKCRVLLPPAALALPQPLASLGEYSVPLRVPGRPGLAITLHVKKKL